MGVVLQVQSMALAQIGAGVASLGLLKARVIWRFPCLLGILLVEQEIHCEGPENWLNIAGAGLQNTPLATLLK